MQLMETVIGNLTGKGIYEALLFGRAFRRNVCNWGMR